MNKYLALLFLLIPAMSGESTTTEIQFFPVPMPTEPRPPLLDVGALAKVLHCECRGESLKGMAYVSSTLQNRASDWGGTIHEQSLQGYCKMPHDRKLWALAAKLAASAPLHRFKYFLAPKRATNAQMLRLMNESEREVVGGHVFF